MKEGMCEVLRVFVGVRWREEGRWMEGRDGGERGRLRRFWEGSRELLVGGGKGEVRRLRRG